MPARNSATSRDLPTPAGADDGDELAAAASPRRAPRRLRAAVELLLAPDERRVEAPLARPSAETATSRQAGTGSALPFSVERLDGLGLDRLPREPQRPLAEEDLAGPRSLLEPGGDVDRVTRREPLRGAGDDLAAC